MRATYGDDLQTPLHLDWGHFGENLWQVARQLTVPGVWPWLMLLVAVTSGHVALLVRGSRRPAETISSEHGLLGGALLLAWAPFPVLVLVDWIRLNLYLLRYFTLPLFFGAFAVLFALAGALAGAGPRRTAAVALIGALLACVFVPVSPPPRGLVEARERAVALFVAAGEGAFLIDDYWNTYRFAAVLPVEHLIPLPYEGDVNRFPWLPRRLPRAPAVLLCTSALVGNEPPKRLLQYGVELVRTDREPRVIAGRTYALYQPDATER